MITIREHLNGQIRRSHNAMLGGFVVIIVGMYVVAFLKSPWAAVVPGLGFVLVLAAGLFRTFLIRCPKCRHPVGAFGTAPLGGSRGVSPEVRVCPFCVVDLDTEIGAR